MRRVRGTTAFRFFAPLFIVVSLLLSARPFLQTAEGAYLGAHGIEISDNTGGARGVQYNVQFTTATFGTLGSVEIQFCANSPLIADSCDAPWGFDATEATILNQTGITDFTYDAGISTVNDVVLTRIPSSEPAGQTATVELGGIINPTDEGSYFARILTHASTDATGTATDAGGLAFNILPSLLVSSEVPPYLIFCTGVTISGFDCGNASGDFSDFGTLTPTSTQKAQSQFMAATNAGNGYSVSVTGTSLTSGNNVIATMTGGTATPGVSQFGLNLRANTSPVGGTNPTGTGTGVPTANYNVPNHYRYTDGDTIATATTAQEYRKYTASYVVDVDKSQPAGVYSTTITYVCLANF